MQECENDYYQASVYMSPSQYKYLKDYVDEKWNSTAEVHSILSSMLQHLRLDVAELMASLLPRMWSFKFLM